MNTIQYFKQFVSTTKKTRKVLKILKDNRFETDRIRGELLRNVHSIEKGLSLRNVRNGFGFLKIKEAGEFANRLLDMKQGVYAEEVRMFIGALAAYLDYHKKVNYRDTRLLEVEELFTKLSNRLTSTDNGLPLGGYQQLDVNEHSQEDFEAFNQLVHSRHSIREFSNEPVPLGKILTAIDLARYCPNACNRQAFGVHVVCKDKISVFQNWFDGVGGFADELDKLLLITAKLSSYRKDEEMQYIVSASVFAGYLTLALEVCNIGCCFIQRPVLPSEQWQNISGQLKISQDEQIVCALGVGMKPKTYKVPISHRISLDRVVTIHGTDT